MAENQQKSDSKRNYGVWIKTKVATADKTFTDKFSGVKHKRNADLKSVFDAVSLLWPAEVWQSIVDATSERATLKKAGWGANDSPDEPEVEDEMDEDHQDEEVSDDESSSGEEEESDEGVSANWHNTYVAELKFWFGILMVMGLCPEPALRNYWSKEKTSNGIYGNDFIRKSGMSRDRWLQIRKHLFCDINWLSKITQENSQKIWRPFPFMAVDETLLLFKGKFKYRQHIKGKPNATGLKIYALCDNKGYIYGFWFYQGGHPSYIS